QRVPPGVDGWDRTAVAVLVGKLFQGDGCVHAETRSIFYATSSEGLAGDVRRLLLKLGIDATVHQKPLAYRGGWRAGYTVTVQGGRPTLARFHELVGPHLVGRRQRTLATLVASDATARRSRAHGSLDVLPLALCREPIREAIRK